MEIVLCWLVTKMAMTLHEAEIKFGFSFVQILFIVVWHRNSPPSLQALFCMMLVLSWVFSRHFVPSCPCDVFLCHLRWIELRIRWNFSEFFLFYWEKCKIKISFIARQMIDKIMWALWNIVCVWLFYKNQNFVLHQNH